MVNEERAAILQDWLAARTRLWRNLHANTSCSITLHVILNSELLAAGGWRLLWSWNSYCNQSTFHSEAIFSKLNFWQHLPWLLCPSAVRDLMSTVKLTCICRGVVKPYHAGLSLNILNFWLFPLPPLCFLFRWIGFRKPNRCPGCCCKSLGRVWCNAACGWATSRSSAPSHEKVLWSSVAWFGRRRSSPTSLFGATEMFGCISCGG